MPSKSTSSATLDGAIPLLPVAALAAGTDIFLPLRLPLPTPPPPPLPPQRKLPVEGGRFAYEGGSSNSSNASTLAVVTANKESSSAQCLW